MNNLSTKILIVFTIFFFTALGVYTFMVPEFRKGVSMATAVTPENYTELYFEDHLNLSKSAALKEPQTFSFTIHNLENKTMNYTYEIYVQDTVGSSSGITTNSISLRHDQQKTITESYEILAPVTRAKVVVNLVNKNQQIHYWIGEENK